MNTVDPSYPIGKFSRPDHITDEQLADWLGSIEQLPGKLEKLVANLSSEQLEARYKPGSWTVRQVIHHIPDSHFNGYSRVKMAATEDNPTIKPYDQDGWSMLADVSETDVKISIDLLKALHHRLVHFLRSLDNEQLERTYHHPEDKNVVSIKEFMGLYAWHGEHHLAHIKLALGMPA